MAKFEPAYNDHVKPWEGNGVYAWLPDDKGGETYAGISRVANPTWSGWTVVDFEKHRLKVDRLKNGWKIIGIEPSVTQWYRDLWDKYKMGNLVSQDIANLVFDFMVNSGPGNVEKVIGPIVGAKKMSTILELLNTGDLKKLHDQIKAARTTFLKGIVERDPTQAKFLTGWLNRVNSFPDLSTGLKIGGGLLLILIAAGVILLSLK